jgi:hypothetical protein
VQVANALSHLTCKHGGAFANHLINAPTDTERVVISTWDAWRTGVATAAMLGGEDRTRKAVLHLYGTPPADSVSLQTVVDTCRVLHVDLEKTDEAEVKKTPGPVRKVPAICGLLIAILIGLVLTVSGFFIWYYAGGPGSLSTSMPFLPPATPAETSVPAFEDAVWEQISVAPALESATCRI